MAKWTLVIGIGLILVTGGFRQSASAAEAAKKETQSAKIHDAGKHYPGNWTAWAISFKNKAAWKQVPYEKTDYKFVGDTVLENKFFYISFNANSQDDLNVKKGKGTLWRNIFYRCYYPKKIKVGGTKRYASRTKHVKILKNTPNEVMVEHTGTLSSIMTTYRIFRDKPWVEVKPVKNAHMLGLHGKVRMALAVVEGGNDYVIDSLRDPKHCYVPPKGRLVICFFESVKNPFMWVLTFPSFKRANTYFNCDSGPKGDTMWCDPGTRGGLKIPKKWPGCITATYSRFGKQTEPVVEGALAYWHNWYRDHPDRPIKKGEVYTCKWKPPYPGKWRMTVRIAEKKYDQGFKYDGKTKFPAKYFSRDVIVSKKSTNDGKFTFKSPINGWLDYSIIYMYDRTKETPKDILTPMDQYRWTIRQGKKNDKKTGQTPNALGGVLAGACATGIKMTDNVKTKKRAKAVKKGFRVIKTSGSCSRITLSFNRDLDPKEARRAKNYQITPADAEQLQVVAVGKFVTLSGLKLKKSKKYVINISDAVKDTSGKAIAKANRTVEYTPVYDKRKIRVSTVQPLRMDEWEKHYSTGDKGIDGYLEYVMGLVEEAGQMRSDIVCLPEAISITSRFKRSRYIPGPFFNTLAEKAKKHSMYIVAHMLEKEEKLLKTKGPKFRRSTAFIIDRKGELLGKFRKVHLTEGESRYVVPGDTFPVFQTDFGKIGALICFDVIAYSESMRLLALNGAEIVFFPHATGRSCEKDIITRSRAMAMENGLYIVPSHYGRIISDDHGWFGRSSVIGPDGFIRADAGTDPGVASAVIDLEKKRLGYGWGTGGVNDIRDRIFKHRRPAIYGGLSEKKKPSSSSDKRGK